MHWVFLEHPVAQGHAFDSQQSLWHEVVLSRCPLVPSCALWQQLEIPM